MKLLQIVIAALMAQALAAQAPPTASVSGAVLYWDTKEPIAKSKLELRPSSGAVSIVATSDERGNFLFPAVAPGQYRLFASKAGYVLAEHGQPSVGGPGLPIVVSGAKAIADLRLLMTPGSIISGRVLDRGKPAGNTSVYAVKTSYELGHRVTTNVLSAITNDLGEYSIFWLPPGRYYILATIYDGPPRTAPVMTSIGDNTPNLSINPVTQFVFTRAISSVITDTEMHVPMFHPGVPDLREARPIDVEPGTRIRDIDVRADTVHALHVRGSVKGIPLAANGQPAPVTISLLPTDGSNPARATGRVEQDMSFDISSVRPGSYILAAVGGTSTARFPVDVYDQDVNGVSVDLRPAISLTGRVVVEGQNQENSGTILAAVRIALLLDPILGGFRDDYGASRPVVAFAPSANGSFTTPASATALGYPPGTYRVIVPPLISPAAGWTSPLALPTALTTTALPATLQNAYVKSISLGDTDVLNGGLHLTTSIREPLVIVIGTNAGAVEGRVVNGGGQAASAATVVLIPENNLRFRIAHRSAITDADGRFRIAGVAPGDYKLFSWEKVERGAWQDPDFVRSYESTGKSIRVEEGGQLMVELQSNSR